MRFSGLKKTAILFLIIPVKATLTVVEEEWPTELQIPIAKEYSLLSQCPQGCSLQGCNWRQLASPDLAG